MLKQLLFKIIALYQHCVSLLLPSCCRFYPSCSTYANEAIKKYGPLSGLCKAIKRISLCHPLSGKSGYDPLL